MESGKGTEKRISRLWEIRYEVSDFYYSGIKFPFDRFEIDRTKILKKLDENIIAYVAEQSFGNELIRESEKDMGVFFQFYCLVAGHSPIVKSTGGTIINSVQELGEGNRRSGSLRLWASYPPEKSRELTVKLKNRFEIARTLYEKYKDLIYKKEMTFLKLALTYNYQSFLSGVRLEEQYINAAISLECLLNEAPSDIAYKIALRSDIICKIFPMDDLGDIFREVKKLYRIRNDIVHGQKFELTDADLSNIRRIVHRCLTYCLVLAKMKKPKTKKELIDIIDKAIMNCSERANIENIVRKEIHPLYPEKS